MVTSKTYAIKNWLTFQHYGDKRTPPWIKLHFEMLTSHDWVMLADASKLLMIVCMMVASRNKGRVYADPKYLQKVAQLDKTPDLKPLLQMGFLLDDGLMLADAIAAQANAGTNEEKEEDAYSKDEDAEEEKDKEGRFGEFWNLYPSGSRVGRKPCLDLWQKRKLDKVADQIIFGLQQWIGSDKWQKNDGQYIPHSKTFLNNEIWADVAAAMKTVAKPTHKTFAQAGEDAANYFLNQKKDAQNV